MHYVFFYPFTQKSIYFSCKQDVIDWIESHRYLINRSTKNIIHVYRCPNGFNWYLKNHSNYSRYSDYWIGTLGQFINSL